MPDKITYKQLKELQEVYHLDEQRFVELLEEYTGITRKSYTAYNYYDDAGNYVGNSEDFDLLDIIDNAYIEISDEVKHCSACGAPYVGKCCPNCMESETQHE